MIFPTATFTIFFLIVLPLSWLAMADMRRWRVFIIVASYIFYGWWDWHFIFLLAGSTLWTQLFAVQIHKTSVRSRRKALLVVGLAGNLGLLGYFKYYDFFVSSAHNLAADAGMGLPLSTRAIVLPVGISFFTFMAISYLVDTYRGDFEPVTLPRFGGVPLVLPSSRRGPDRTSGRVAPPDGDARATRGGSTRAGPST